MGAWRPAWRQASDRPPIGPRSASDRPPIAPNVRRAQMSKKKNKQSICDVSCTRMTAAKSNLYQWRSVIEKHWVNAFKQFLKVFHNTLKVWKPFQIHVKTFQMLGGLEAISGFSGEASGVFFWSCSNTVAPRFKNMVPPEGSPLKGLYIAYIALYAKILIVVKLFKKIENLKP